MIAVSPYIRFLDKDIPAYAARAFYSTASSRVELMCTSTKLRCKNGTQMHAGRMGCQLLSRVRSSPYSSLMLAHPVEEACCVYLGTFSSVEAPLIDAPFTLLPLIGPSSISFWDRSRKALVAAATVISPAPIHPATPLSSSPRSQ